MVMAAILFKLDSPESDTDEEMMTMSKDDTSTCSVQAEGEVDNIDETCAQEKSPELATEVTRSTCALLLKRDLPQESSEIYEAKAEVKLQLSKVNEIINVFNEMWRFLTKYHHKHGSFVSVLNEWLNKNTMEEDDQTETEAPKIFRVCSALLVYNNMTRHSRFENAARWQREL
ncbi:hypothetical protein DY000_02018531 [Brassica cretica]|uniref:DUF632 domain-containing protein n=1 Tax=Brassica cretica TaxID=69181 RepID=A0ABQ7CVK4_BRACR|nr:hypothetical protein DY000_02018531 [Brassica cretica]